jgi:para-nitrobenzyl esterase
LTTHRTILTATSVLAALLSAVLAQPSRAAPAPSDAPVVKTLYGRVRGMAADASGEVWVYRGIPYAAAPTGARRWREPQPPERWSEIRSATQPPPACMQRVGGGRLPWTPEYMHAGAVSEDCLYLNVWSAAHHSGPSRPVLVYIYGGGFSEGSSTVPIYDGTALARRNLIVVTLNYRLGALGFLAHPGLTQESAHHASGNYGLLDQVAALRWVHDNIQAFGGDPHRVTIVGQSAGAISAYLLTASPLASGLFAGAIIQSGPGALASLGIPGGGAATPREEDAEKEGVKYATSLGAATLEELRALDARRLLPSPTGPPTVRFGPIVDGWFLSADAATVYAQHHENDVPLIIGMMADEGSAFPGYQQAQAAEPRRRAIEAIDALLAQRARSSREPAYAYYFVHPIPWPQHPEYGAFHSGELPYTFDNLGLLERPWTAGDRALASTVSGYWAQFVATGHPGSPSLPAWVPYVPGSFNFMVFGEESTVRDPRVPHHPVSR